MNQSTKLIQKLKQMDRKVGRAITKWGAMEKSSILLLQYWNLSNKPLYKELKRKVQYCYRNIGKMNDWMAP